MDAVAERCRCRSVEFVASSIGKKVLVAAAGLLLCGFLFVHLAGNFLLFVGPAAFNKYAETLEHNPVLPAAEIGLVFLFLVHIALSLKARWANKQARPVDYAVFTGKGARTPGSRTMAISGTLLLAFLVVHIKTFRLAEEKIRETNLFDLVSGAFSNRLYSGFYILALVGLGLHLSHGFQSAFQTLGFNHPRYTPIIRRAGIAFAVLVTIGFASMPLYFGFLGGSK